MQVPYIMDISRYSVLEENVALGKTINWQKAWDAGIRVVAIRATVGNWYTDPLFEAHWEGAKRLGIVTTAYHVIKPSHTYQSQIDRFFDVLSSRKADIPLVVDCELTDNLRIREITSVIQKSVQYIAERDGRNPFIYTRQSWWDPYVLPWSNWHQYPLWVAWYPYDPDYPNVPDKRIPRDWKDLERKWVLWQYSADNNNQGAKYGCESRSVDLNKYNGTPEEFDREFNTNISESSPSESSPQPQETISVEDFVIDFVYPLMVKNWTYTGPKPVKK